jgi:hypothetical protein
MKELEEELGVVLFARTTRSTRMTCSNRELDAWMPPRTKRRRSGSRLTHFAEILAGSADANHPSWVQD